MCAAKTGSSVWRSTTGFLLYAFALLWVLWILFGYRSHLLPQHAHRKPPDVRPPMETTTPSSPQSGENTTSPSKKPSVTASATRRRPKSSRFRDTCWKPQCIALADIIAGGLGKANPCEDFHAFVCGDQEESKGVRSSAMKISALRGLQDILKYSHAARRRTLSASDKFRAAYKSCLAGGNNSSQLQAVVLRALKRRGFEEWPAVKKEPAENTHENYQKIFKSIGLRPFFDYRVRGKPKRAKQRPTITITKPADFFVSDDKPSQRGALVDAHKLRNMSEPKAVREELSDPGLVRYKKFIARAIALLNSSISEEQSKLLADDIIAFEKTLAQLSNQATLNKVKIKVISGNSTLSARNFTIRSALQEDLEAVNVTLDDGIQVMLEYPDYYTSFLDTMSKMNDAATITNYAAWTYVRSLAEMEGTPLHDLYLAYKSNATLSKGSQKSTDVAALCIKQLLQPHMMRIAGASLYSKYNFNKYDRNNVNKMINFIMSSFTKIVTENKWMSLSTKKKVIQRLSRMELIIGYPDWMLNDAEVDGLYKFIPHLTENASFVEHLIWMQENSHNQQLLKLKAEFEEKEFADVALFPHMYYIERTDTLVLPAAELVPYYKRPPMPRALNFGTVGALAGFLIVNVLDRFDTFLVADNGKRTGSKLVTEEFWDQETKRNFCEASDCLKNEECREKKHLKNGSEARLDEYIGLRASFMALKKSIDNYTRPHLLPGTDFDTEDKIFFLSFGHLFCPFNIGKSLARSRSDDSAANQDGDSYKKRLNDVMKGFDGFQKAFKCAVTKDECNLLPPAIRR
ncbi:neprilysin-2-like isoform X2 [Amblyomma americanum]